MANPMFLLDVARDDDPAFIGWASRLIAGAAYTHRTADVFIHSIDNWFDHKWLRFSGKTFGTIGVWSDPVTIPPFVANRIAGRRLYRHDPEADAYRLAHSSQEIHHRGWSSLNLLRRAGRVVPGASLFWLSGNTLATGRGSLMSYIPVDEGYWTWYVSFVRSGGWRLGKRKNIHLYEIRLFERTAERLQPRP